MAHHLKVETVPDTNKDGSPSKTKKTYLVYDRPRRGGKILKGKTTSKKMLPQLLNDVRAELLLGAVRDACRAARNARSRERLDRQRVLGGRTLGLAG